MNPRILEEGLKNGHRCDDIPSKRAPFMGFFQTHILWLSHDWVVDSVSFITLVLEKCFFFVLSSTNNHLLRSQNQTGADFVKTFYSSRLCIFFTFSDHVKATWSATWPVARAWNCKQILWRTTHKQHLNGGLDMRR